MSDFFYSLAGISFIALWIGIIKPSLVIKWGDIKTRKKVFLFFGLPFIIFGFIACSFENDKPNNEEKISISTEKETKSTRTKQGKIKIITNVKFSKMEKDIANSNLTKKQIINEYGDPLHDLKYYYPKYDGLVKSQD